MPSTLTYPGVYVEEIPSGVRTIVGVATSITAFIGRAARGPTNTAVTINSFGDFEKQFGGLWVESSLGFAVRDFFLNGGSQAVIVRLYHPDPGSPNANPPVPTPGTRQALTVGDLKFVAANEGKWGINLRVSVDVDHLSADVAALMGVTTADLFNLTVRDLSPGGKTERHVNVTVKDSPRRVDKVLMASSDLLRYDGVPDPAAKIAAGADDLGTKEQTYAAAQK